jgi:hypothetical protein
MNFFKKNKYIFLAILLPATLYLYFNSATNGHYHKLANGEVVYHTHPYHHQTTKDSPFESHHHSNFEYCVLAQISNPFVLLSFFLLLLDLFITCDRKFEYPLNVSFTASKYYFRNVYRGPPVS